MGDPCSASPSAKVGYLVGTQQEEKQKEGGSWLGVQGRGATGQGEAQVADKPE